MELRRDGKGAVEPRPRGRWFCPHLTMVSIATVTMWGMLLYYLAVR